MKLYKTTVRGAVRWVADHGRLNGKRRRKFFATKDQAKAELETVELQRKTAGDVWLGLSPSERLEAAQIICECRKLNLTLRQVWDGYLECATQTPHEVVTLGAAVDKFIAAKRGNGNRASYTDSLDSVLTRFREGRDQFNLHKVTFLDVESFLEGYRNPHTRRGMLRRMGSFFSWSVKRGWCRENPVDRIDNPRIEQQAPLILTPRQAARVAVWTRRNRPRALAAIVLGMFAGVRPHEVYGIKWADVKLDEKVPVLVIDAAASKVAQRRIVHLEPAAVAWLRVAKREGAVLPATREIVRPALRRLARMLGFKRGWPADLLRHTAASYLLAARRDAGAVAIELGNSVSILFRHYRELVSRKDADRFWRLVPRPHRYGN